MSAAVVLDSTPLGILCNPRTPPHVLACRQWLAALHAAGRRVIKLADPDDLDDKKWTARWLSRYQKEVDKKRERRSLKQREKQIRSPTKRAWQPR